jgi:hypothetical protein
MEVLDSRASEPGRKELRRGVFQRDRPTARLSGLEEPDNQLLGGHGAAAGLAAWKQLGQSGQDQAGIGRPEIFAIFGESGGLGQQGEPATPLEDRRVVELGAGLQDKEEEGAVSPRKLTEKAEEPGVLSLLQQWLWDH